MPLELLDADEMMDHLDKRNDLDEPEDALHLPFLLVHEETLEIGAVVRILENLVQNE